MSALIETLTGQAIERQPRTLQPQPMPQVAQQLLSLEDRVVLVTGAAGALGAAIAKDLLAQGARVVLADINRLKAGELARELDPSGERSLVVTCDVTDEEDCAAVVERCVSHFGALDVLVNNASANAGGALDETSIEDFDRMLAINLRGPFMLVKAALPALLEGYDGEGGQVVNIASSADAPGLTPSIRAELRARGVRVTHVIAGGSGASVAPAHANAALGVRFALTVPRGSVVPEPMVLPESEISWP